MAGSYTADEQYAVKMRAAMCDSHSELIVGVVTKTTSQTTALVTHGLSGTPDFIMGNVQADAGSSALLQPAITANGTSVTFTIATAQTNWSVAYIIGYTA